MLPTARLQDHSVLVDSKQPIPPRATVRVQYTSQVIFRAERARPAEDVDYDAFSIESALVNGVEQYREPRPAELMFRQLRLPSDRDANHPRRDYAALDTCEPGNRIEFVVTNRSGAPERFAVHLDGSMVP